jgi:membrane protein
MFFRRELVTGNFAAAFAHPRLVRAGQVLLPTVRFWMQTEVHVYAFSIAANILLSFFPFLIVIMSLCRYVLKWRAAMDTVYFALNDYFPGPISKFLTVNLQAVIAKRGTFQLVSILVLLFTANGVFEPLEVAFNRIWRCPTDRSFFKNQLVSIGLIFVCGTLILASTMLTAYNQRFVGLFGAGPTTHFLQQLFFELASIPMSILVLFLIYWVLPNCKMKAANVLPAAIIVGFLLEVLKYINLLTWPHYREKFYEEYGPFSFAATLILWGFLASMLILAGAEWAARRAEERSAGAPGGSPVFEDMQNVP